MDGKGEFNPPRYHTLSSNVEINQTRKIREKLRVRKMKERKIRERFLKERKLELKLRNKNLRNQILRIKRNLREKFSK